MCQGVVQASEKCNICGSHAQLDEKLKEVENLKLKLVNLRQVLDNEEFYL